jgi:16S rRNA (guanine527-N7)-methyltransferase
MVKKGGFLCAYKAKLANIKEEMEGIKKLVPEYEVCPLTVPGLEDSERNIVIIKRGP